MSCIEDDWLDDVTARFQCYIDSTASEDVTSSNTSSSSTDQPLQSHHEQLADHEVIVIDLDSEVVTVSPNSEVVSVLPDPAVAVVVPARTSYLEGKIRYEAMLRPSHGIDAEAVKRLADTILARYPGHTFKVGITRCPEHRFENTLYGYGPTEQCKEMWLLHCSENVVESQQFERHLISCYKGSDLCRNEQGGGEGISRAGGAVYIYLVMGGASRSYWQALEFRNLRNFSLKRKR